MRWLFGYGSLMWDGWEARFECAERQVADLKGYSRAFNKASVRNWGTKLQPGPTLNIRETEGAVCTGIAFGFADDADALAYLKEREGGFLFFTVALRLHDGRQVNAITSLYRGKNLLPDLPASELVDMAVRARGTDGKAMDYVLNIEHQLIELNISDHVVTALADAIRANGSVMHK
ncbi:uncharacterized protein involved in cation transport [Mesorhizobium australicum WSM2073]|uniref:glutathione-specific gamma-glutamylcyclotransferase n=1 Tax=Mesorhizobium australicum (strain HAMBI 3006 / LMG 24608 / WSM2073) TaxID=754035 RepID=L0KSX8_MESAW|nr:gamma-glutamylcyclotransferase [Mesorhizobium australicum]AGB48221.1 uncharacterized protein involved in cation transport [Mesorhizobium australicum WSM2073]